MQTSQELIANARGLMQAGQLAEADTALIELAEREPENPTARTLLGVCRKLQGDAEAALAHLQAAAAMDEHHSDSHFQLGHLLHELGRRDEAESELNKAITADPNHVPARVALGQLYRRSNRPELAAEALKLALRADEDSVPALAEMAATMLALGQVDEAESHASRAVRTQPDDPRGQVAMAGVFQARGHLDFAEQCLENALEKTPDNVSLWSALGSLFKRQERYVEAAAAFERAEQLLAPRHLDPPALMAMAESLYATGHHRPARERLELLNRHLRLEGDALLLLAEVRLATGDPAGSRDLLPRLRESIDGAAQLVEAWLAETDEDMPRAAELADGLHGSDHAYIDRHARLISGRAALPGGDVERARSALEPLLKSEPSAGWLLADVCRRTGDRDGARAALDAVLAECRELPARQAAMTHARLAWLLDELDEVDVAIHHLERSGWQGLPMPAEVVRRAPEFLHSAFLEMRRTPWSSIATDDDKPQPVFVLGWPGSGRESIIAALRDAGMPLLDAADGQRRHRAIGLPLALPDLERQSEASVRLTRKRYFRGVRSSGVVVEPMWFDAAALPALARFFPGATVIVLEAEAGDLEFHWRLAGHQFIDDALAAWHQDRELLDHLREVLDLNFVAIPTAMLLTDRAEAVRQLDTALVPGDVEAWSPRLESSLDLTRLKPSGRWRHYAEVLSAE